MAEPRTDPRGSQEVVFDVESTRRLLVKERRVMFHHRTAVCFYTDEAAPHGWLVGIAALHMDGPDMQAFVVFVCFFGVVMPLICMVTALLHINKQERCKQHVQQLRLQVQREMLSAELSERAGGAPFSATSASGGGSPQSHRGASSRLERALHTLGIGLASSPGRRRGSLLAMMEAAHGDMYGVTQHRQTRLRETVANMDEQLAFVANAVNAATALAASQPPSAASSSSSRAAARVHVPPLPGSTDVVGVA